MRVIIVLALIACVVLAKPAAVTKPVKVIPSSVPTTPRPKEIEVACTFQGDPHVRSPFNAFDFFDSGDYLFANFDNKVKIIGRTNTVPAYGKQAVTTAVMVIANHHGKQVKVSVHAKDRSLQVDHKPTTLANKKSIENKAVGITVTHDSQEVYIVTVGTIRVLLSFKGAGANSYVDVSIFSSKSAADRVTGLCGKKKLIQKDDQAFVSKRTHYTPLPNPKRYRREDAERFCARLPTAIARHFCISDYLLGGEELAKSSYTIETEKKNFREFYRLPKKCRQAIRRHKFLVNSGRHAEAHAFKKFVEHACAKKRVSKKCRYFKHTYAKYAHNFNKAAPRLSVAQRTHGANQLRLLGEKVQLACSKRARVACRQGRQTAVARLNKEIAEQQAKLNKLHAELRAAKARKCHV